MTMQDIRLEGLAKRLGQVMTAVVIENGEQKEYRLPTQEELRLAGQMEAEQTRENAEIPFGIHSEPIPQGASRTGGGSAFTVYIYGFQSWPDLFTRRQLVELATFVKHTRAAAEAMRTSGYPQEWVEAVAGELAIGVDKLADRSSTQCR